MMTSPNAFRPAPQSLPTLQASNPTTAGPLLAREDGAALVTVMFLAAVILTIAVMASRSTQIELRIAHNEVLAKQALNTAEAGLNHAFSLLKTESNGWDTELSNGGTGGVLASLGSLVEVDGTSYRFCAFGAGASDGYYVRVVDNYDETTGADDPAADKDKKITIISRARVGGAERIIQALVNSPSLFGWGVFGKVSVGFGGSGGLSDSYDSRVGSYASTPHGNNGDIASNGNISLTSSVAIHGDATAGGTVSLSSSAVVTGDITNSAPPVTLPLDPVPPCGPPYSSGAGISGAYTYFPTGSKAGQLVVSGGHNATLAPGTYCFSDVTFSGGSTLTVNGPVVVSLTGAGTFSGGGIANTTHNPANLQIFSSLVDPNHAGITISGGSDAYVSVYAPNTGLVLSGSGDIYGSVIANYVSSTGGSKIHYDDALGGGGGGTAKLTAWREARNG